MSSCWAAKSHWNCFSVRCYSLFLCTYWKNASFWNNVIYFFVNFSSDLWVQIAFLTVWGWILSTFKRRGVERKRNKKKNLFRKPLVCKQWSAFLVPVQEHAVILPETASSAFVPLLFFKARISAICNICYRWSMMKWCLQCFFFPYLHYCLMAGKRMEIWKPVCLSRNTGYTCRINISIVIM